MLGQAFPAEWPRDRVLEAGSLNPVDAARHVLVFTRILYGIRLDRLHDECIVDSINWLRSLRTASRTLRVLGVPRALFDLWTDPLEAAPVPLADPALAAELAALRAVLDDPLDRSRQVW